MTTTIEPPTRLTWSEWCAALDKAALDPVVDRALSRLKVAEDTIESLTARADAAEATAREATADAKEQYALRQLAEVNEIDAKKERDAATAAAAAMMEAIGVLLRSKIAQHGTFCASTFPLDPGPCDCGVPQALALLRSTGSTTIGKDWRSPEAVAALVAEKDAEIERLRSFAADHDRLRLEVIGALTSAGEYLRVDADPTAPGEVRRAIERLSAARLKTKSGEGERS